MTLTRYDRDIHADPEEVTSYRDWIENHNDQKYFKITLRDELETVCRNDFINRCSVLLDIIQEEGDLSLLQPPFLKVQDFFFVFWGASLLTEQKNR